MDNIAPAARPPVPGPACERARILAPEVTVSDFEFRDAMSKFTTAVSVIATDGVAGLAGLTCSAVCSVSDSPATLAVCIHGGSSANSILKANRVLSVNCLHTEQRELSQAFAGVGKLSVAERFAMANWEVLTTGAPCCKDALVVLDCSIVDVRDVGTHSVFIVTVMATAKSQNRQPLVYRQRNYATTCSL
ncbi:MAG: flavin reductase family protein [Pseudorhodoplanes sp.]|uniref:flavin reductase family protein n=1 Tax=Pseudorhodoplanes sp. TaxID=1934341 RepID=UPI003D141E95